MGNSGDRRGGRVWARQVNYVVNRDKTCLLAYPDCCTGRAETADHIVPYAAGGTDTPDNLQGVCRACNWKRGDDELPIEHLQMLAKRGLGPLVRTQRLEQEKADVARRLVDTGFQILYDGAAKPSHRRLLASMGVKAMMLSYWDLTRVRRKLAKGYDDLLLNQFPADVEIFVESGWAKATEKLNPVEQEMYAEEYTEFIERYRDRISGATEPHLVDLGAAWMAGWRHERGPAMGVIWWPVWRPHEGMPALMKLAEEYDNVALPQEALEKDPVVPPRLGALHRRYQTNFHALGCANPDTLKGVALATASTQSWASPQMRGETIVWDGTRLVRYRADRKDQARARYKAVAESAGLDHQAILGDDATEVTRLAVWSYQQLEKSMQKPRPAAFESPFDAQDVTDRADAHTPARDQVGQGGVGDRPDTGLNSSGQVEPAKPRGSLSPRDPQERITLPVFGVEMDTATEYHDGEPVEVQRPKLRSQPGSMRQCNTCVISGNCPAFEPDASCKFDLPVEVRSKDQMQALLYSLLEMQAGRVAFAKFAEDMNGGYPDPNLSQELDRFMRMTKSVKDLEDNRQFERITVERQTSGGLLSNLFGERAKPSQELPQVIQADEVIQGELMPGTGN